MDAGKLGQHIFNRESVQFHHLYKQIDDERSMDICIVDQCVFAAVLNVHSVHEPVWWVAHLFVHEAYRKKGYARGMLTWLIAEATLQGARGISLSVDERNAPARKLYHSLGFWDVLKSEHEHYMVMSYSIIPDDACGDGLKI